MHCACRCTALILAFLVCLSVMACNSVSGIAPTDPHTNLHQIKAEIAAAPVLIGENGELLKFDPTTLTVSLLEGAVVPDELRGLMPAGLAAADGSNVNLRSDRQYETVTDAIASHYNLTIRNQVYQGDVRLVGFNVPYDVDGASVITAMQREFSGAVETAEFSSILRIDAVVNDPDYGASTSTTGLQWGHRRIGCSRAWDMTRGAGIVVAVVDTGVHFAHEELQAQVLVPADAYPGQTLDIVNNDNTVEDTHGHGTFIAGLIAAEGNNNRTIIGAAYECEIIPIKISNDGVALDVDVANGIILATNLGAKVVNVSYGSTIYNDAINTAMNQVRQAGVLVVASAGNDGTNETNYPGGYDAVLNVGSTKVNDSRSDFSNWDETIEIAAPGESLKSCTPGTNTYNTNGFGTSYAAPMVAAAAGLLWAFDSTLSVNAVENLFLNTGQPTTDFTQNTVVRLDIAAAMDAACPVIITAPKAEQLVYSGVFALSLTVSGDPESNGRFCPSYMSMLNKTDTHRQSEMLQQPLSVA